MPIGSWWWIECVVSFLSIQIPRETTHSIHRIDVLVNGNESSSSLPSEVRPAASKQGNAPSSLLILSANGDKTKPTASPSPAKTESNKPVPKPAITKSRTRNFPLFIHFQAVEKPSTTKPYTNKSAPVKTSAAASSGLNRITCSYGSGTEKPKVNVTSSSKPAVKTESKPQTRPSITQKPPSTTKIGKRIANDSHCSTKYRKSGA